MTYQNRSNRPRTVSLMIIAAVAAPALGCATERPSTDTTSDAQVSADAGTPREDAAIASDASPAADAMIALDSGPVPPDAHTIEPDAGDYDAGYPSGVRG